MIQHTVVEPQLYYPLIIATEQIRLWLLIIVMKLVLLRDALCTMCNLPLRHANDDDVELLQQMIDYLNKHKQIAQQTLGGV